MSIRIGHGHKATADNAVALLHACHSNVRRFLATARALASEKSAAIEDIAATSSSVSRYFREALPLHVADEEESIAPRLQRASANAELVARFGGTVSEILGRMLAEHASHEALVARVVSLCDELGQAPERRSELAPRLGPAAADLSQSLESHLLFEEEHLFPLLPHLGAEQHLEILGEMRKRRGTARVWP